MSRNMLMDIIKKKKGDKQDHSNKKEAKAERADRTVSSRDIFIKEFERSSGGSMDKTNSKFLLWLLAIICIFFMMVAISSLFQKATITVHPKMQNFNLDESFDAIKDSTNEGDLSFQIMSLRGEESKEIPAGDPQIMQQKATGTVILYNTYSEAPQRLLITTRLEATNGKIYTTDKPLTIPGMEGSIPGSIEVGIHAQDFGEEFNSPMTDFKIVGFKGSPKYDKFYGRSKTEINGGIDGEVRTLDPGGNDDIKKELEVMLKAKLMKQALAQIPENYILYPGAMQLSGEVINIPAISIDGSDFSEASIKATMYAFIFEEKQLTKIMSSKLLSQYDETNLQIPGIRDMEFSIISPSELDWYSFPSKITFSLKGYSDIIWPIDESSLIEFLISRKKSEFQNILASFPNIASSEISLRPFWTRSFPDDKSRIKILNANTLSQ